MKTAIIKNKQVFIIIIPVITTLTVTIAIIIILIIIAIIRSLKFYKQEKKKSNGVPLKKGERKSTTGSVSEGQTTA